MDDEYLRWDANFVLAARAVQRVAIAVFEHIVLVCLDVVTVLRAVQTDGDPKGLVFSIDVIHASNLAATPGSPIQRKKRISTMRAAVISVSIIGSCSSILRAGVFPKSLSVNLCASSAS